MHTNTLCSKWLRFRICFANLRRFSEVSLEIMQHLIAHRNSFFEKQLPIATRGFRLGFKIKPCLAFACHQRIKISKTEVSPHHHLELEGFALGSSDSQFWILQPNLVAAFFHLNSNRIEKYPLV